MIHLLYGEEEFLVQEEAAKLRAELQEIKELLHNR